MLRFLREKTHSQILHSLPGSRRQVKHNSYSTYQIRQVLQYTKSNSSFRILEALLKASLGQYSHASPGLRNISAKTISSCLFLEQKEVASVCIILTVQL